MVLHTTITQLDSQFFLRDYFRDSTSFVPISLLVTIWVLTDTNSG